MKKCITVFSVFVLVIILGGCKTGSHDAYKEIYERYNNMDSFFAVTEIVVKNDKTENVYVAKQYFCAPNLMCFELETPEILKGSGFKISEKGLRLVSGFGYNEEVGRYIPNSRNVLFISDFFDEYYKSEESSVYVSSDSGSPVTVLECFLNGKNRNRFMQKLYIDNKTYLPVKLETLNVEKETVVSVRFNEFKRNCEIDKNVFE